MTDMIEKVLEQLEEDLKYWKQQKESDYRKGRIEEIEWRIAKIKELIK